MANKNYRSQEKKSVCELSILLVANIIRLSALRFAAAGLSAHKTNLPNPTSQQDQHSQINTRSRRFVSHGAEDVDENATIYIKEIRGKINGNAAANTASEPRLRPSKTSNMPKK